MKEGKVVVWGGFTTAWEMKQSKSQGRKEKMYTQLKAEFQIARRDRKTYLNEQCKETEETNRMQKTRFLFTRTGDTKGTFHASMGTIKDRNSKDRR